jgi:hypothetical protein
MCFFFCNFKLLLALFHCARNFTKSTCLITYISISSPYRRLCSKRNYSNSLLMLPLLNQIIRDLLNQLRQHFASKKTWQTLQTYIIRHNYVKSLSILYLRIYQDMWYKRVKGLIYHNYKLNQNKSLHKTASVLYN